MDTDDAFPAETEKPAAKNLAAKNLEVLSVEALEAYIGELTAEIERVRQTIALKQDARQEAETFFKSR